LYPQQAIAPVVRTAQVWRDPAVIAANVPEGGVACPSELSPQHARVRLALIPHAWYQPSAIDTNAPAGGVV
jgi:hypothetical protein